MGGLILITQPEGSRWCGQSCLAMVLGVSLERAVELAGRGSNGTAPAHLFPVLEREGFWVGDRQAGAPPFGGGLYFCRVRWPKKGSHWVLWEGRTIFDPGWPPCGGVNPWWPPGSRIVCHWEVRRKTVQPERGAKRDADL